MKYQKRYFDYNIGILKIKKKKQNIMKVFNYTAMYIIFPQFLV